VIRHAPTGYAAAMPLKDRDCWIFDLDGTLTVDLHDFEAIQRELGLKEDARLLEHLASLPPDEAAPLRRKLEAWELDVAQRSEARPHARELVLALRGRGASVAILTRNSRHHATVTLESAGLSDLFPRELVITRDDGPAKPDPYGILHLMERVAASPTRSLIVGDYLFDLEAGRRAGVATVHLDPTGAHRWPDHADVMVRCLSELL
jgi:HAD superfamily hydrolase (TIGR01509 family)